MRIEVQKQPLLSDFLYTLLFGVLSIVLSQVQFHIPGVGNSNLREIPLLICLFHLRNPIFVFALALSTLVGSSSSIPVWIVYGVHVGPLLISIGFFRFLERFSLSATIMGLWWMSVTIVYYLLLLVPLIVMALSFLQRDSTADFWTSYQSILPPIRFEIVASSLVTGLYLMQFEARKTIENHSKDLEKIVEQRTRELSVANHELQTVNEELTASNEGIKELNENLERLVKERTEKINEQLNQLTRYAYMNSHELRAPLARMLGLLQLIKQEQDVEQMKELLGYLHNSSEELDSVVRQMNHLLQKEIEIDKN